LRRAVKGKKSDNSGPKKKVVLEFDHNGHHR
jgi:hypothetical protein